MIEPILEKHKSKLNILPKEYLAIFFNYITSNIAYEYLCYPNDLYDGVKIPGLLSINLNTLDIKEPYENYKLHILDCSNNKKINIILIPVILYDKELNISHFNTVIINKTLRRIEYFEPYGISPIKRIIEFQNKVYTYFTKLINNTRHKYVFKIIGHSCPIGLQTLQEKEKKMPEGTGLCTAWNILIMHTIILNPNYKTSDVVKILIDKYKNNLTEHIRKYVYYLEDLASQPSSEYLELLSDLN